MSIEMPFYSCVNKFSFSKKFHTQLYCGLKITNEKAYIVKFNYSNSSHHIEKICNLYNGLVISFTEKPYTLYSININSREKSH